MALPAGDRLLGCQCSHDRRLNHLSIYVTEVRLKWGGKKNGWRGGHSMEAIYYGAWIFRASDGTLVAELPDFPEVSASGQSKAHVSALASVRLAARIRSMRQHGNALPPATSTLALLDGCVQRRAEGHFWISAMDG